VVNAKVACIDFNLQKTKMQMGVQVWAVTQHTCFSEFSERRSETGGNRVGGRHLGRKRRGHGDASRKLLFPAQKEFRLFVPNRDMDDVVI
jgi:chloramphenicol 3-O-phosphotransferase